MRPTRATAPRARLRNQLQRSVALDTVRSVCNRLKGRLVYWDVLAAASATDFLVKKVAERLPEAGRFNRQRVD